MESENYPMKDYKSYIRKLINDKPINNKPIFAEIIIPFVR